MLKLIKYGAIMMLLTTSSFAQQTQQYSQNTILRYVINPAASGQEEGLHISSGFRKQMWGFGNEPKSVYIGINANFPLKKLDAKTPLAIRTSRTEAQVESETKSNSFKLASKGVGVFLQNDNYGAFNANSVNLTYALHFKLKEKWIISPGLNLNYKSINFDQNKALPEDLQDNFYQDFITSSALSSLLDLGAGIMIRNKKLFIGFSSNQIIGSKVSFSPGAFNNFLVVHHTLIAGYKLKINDKLTLKPNLIYRVLQAAPSNLDINLATDIYDKLFLSFGVRNHTALLFMAGAKFNENLKLYYSYDSSTNNLRGQSAGAHEINLTFKIK